MRRNGWIFGIIIVLVFLVLIAATDSQLPAGLSRPAGDQAETALLVEALTATGARLHDFSLNGWAELPTATVTDNELEELVRVAMARLGIDPADYKLNNNRGRRHRLVRADAAGDRIHVVAIAQVMELTSGEAEAYLVVNVDAINDGGPIDAWRHKIDNIIRDAGGSPRLATCLAGYIDGKLEEAERAKRLAAAFDRIGGTTVDQVHYANFSSFSGYSPAIADWLQVGGQRVNVNMAMRYSPYDDRTYVLIGSPVITREH
ncbi:YwmB family TATA-box binding protein [Sporolituus thermophilus]|uniref:TATA-box binding n=1 Tax=Sporolituus thermophilus DSM 23256 TaxID=1123285 RepID=A0A1G7HGV4_9FIRM|nr:YwmB family TATA-box binding protein [Sporolituus thermophilus]SDE99543.1 TATA-box binding [Sporolituus thermophilus DSM 23256]